MSAIRHCLKPGRQSPSQAGRRLDRTDLGRDYLVEISLLPKPSCQDRIAPCLVQRFFENGVPSVCSIRAIGAKQKPGMLVCHFSQGRFD
jgi:hypothetical protein